MWLAVGWRAVAAEKSMHKSNMAAESDLAVHPVKLCWDMHIYIGTDVHVDIDEYLDSVVH